MNELIVFQDIARYRFWQFTISLSIVWSHFQDKRAPHKKAPTSTLLPVSHMYIVYGCGFIDLSTTHHDFESLQFRKPWSFLTSKPYHVRSFLLCGGCGFREFGSWSSWLAEPQIENSYFWIHVFAKDSVLKIISIRVSSEILWTCERTSENNTKKNKCEAKTFLSDILPIPCQCRPAAACDFETLNAAWLPEALAIQPQLSRKPQKIQHQNMEPKQSHHSERIEPQDVTTPFTQAIL